MMQSPPSIAVKPMFIGSIALIIVGALFVRMSPSPFASDAPATDTASTGVPAFTSATFDTGDAIGSLGPEWTLVRQASLGKVASPDVAGIALERETVAHLIESDVSLLITEFSLVNPVTVQTSLSAEAVQRVRVVGRDAYVVPVAGAAGTNALVLLGETTGLMVEYGSVENGNTMMWPEALPEAVQTYLFSVKLP